jgi:hypothetical protein
MQDGSAGKVGEDFINIDDCRLSIAERKPKRDWWCYLLGAACGAGTGWVDVVVNDFLLTALLVVCSCLLLGLLRPRWAWRWVLTVGVFIPLTELAAYLLRTVKPSPAQVYGSFLAFLPGFAGAYGGSFMRGVVENLRQGK